tara:strand:- start:703 stop:1422 length:720 start_codon:yes stop_codon:yes gene_type:complete
MSNLNSYKKVKNLLSPGATNIKTAKNDLETFILYMAPSTIVEGLNLCPFASEGCKKACLYSAGRGRFSNVQLARINKSKFWGYNRESFYIQLGNELLKIHAKAKLNAHKIAIRLNGTSDIDHLDLLKRYTGINFLGDSYNNLLFYDYTKNYNHIKKYQGTNYKITFSRSEVNELDAYRTLKDGGNIAIVFKNDLPETWKGYKVINGDLTDLRYFDPVNVVVGLKAKGEAKKDLSNFVVA